MIYKPFRYGENTGKVNPGILNALFGDLKGKTPAKGTLIKPAPEKQKEPNYGAPAKTVVDTVDNPCSHYFDAGYRCVPYYQCQNGEVVVDGAGLFDIRIGLADVVLDPSKSKCPGDLEVCCLHPDFEKPPAGPVAPIVPVTLPPVPLPPPIIAVPVTPPPGPVNPPPGPVNPPPVGPINPPPGPGPYPNGPDRSGGSGPQVLIEPIRPKPYVSRCGQRHTGGIGVRIQNSREDSVTQFGEWPHMCALLNKYVKT